VLEAAADDRCGGVAHPNRDEAAKREELHETAAVRIEANKNR
jgi:hypothetical protein